MRTRKWEHLEPAMVNSLCPKFQLHCWFLYYYCLILLGLVSLPISSMTMLILMVGVGLRARDEDLNHIMSWHLLVSQYFVSSWKPAGSKTLRKYSISEVLGGKGPVARRGMWKGLGARKWRQLSLFPKCSEDQPREHQCIQEEDQNIVKEQQQRCSIIWLERKQV